MLSDPEARSKGVGGHLPQDQWHGRAGVPPLHGAAGRQEGVVEAHGAINKRCYDSSQTRWPDSPRGSKQVWADFTLGTVCPDVKSGAWHSGTPRSCSPRAPPVSSARSPSPVASQQAGMLLSSSRISWALVSVLGAAHCQGVSLLPAAV